MKKLRNFLDSKKLNNKGMSLVEILVAVVILAVASVVLLRGFASAALYNQSAAVRQHSITLAQSLMESMKSYSIDVLDTQFASVSNADFKIYKLETSSTKSRTISGESRTYDLKGVKCNDLYYDAKITVTPYTHVPVTGSPAVAVQENLVNIVNPNKYHDAIFRQKETEEFNYFHEDITAAIAAVDPDAVDPGLSGYALSTANTHINSRNMKITITANTVDISVTYNYTITNLSYDVMGLLDPSDPTSLVQLPTSTPYNGTLSTTISFKDDYGQEYDNTATGAVLENIYFYYYPMYDNGAFLNCATDSLTIENNSSSAKTVYLIKQESAQFAYETNYVTAENSYRLNLSASGQPIILYHNVDESIPGGGNPDITSTYAGIANNGSPWKEATTAKPLLYEVKVNVYKNGSTESICELKGSTNIQ